MNSKLIKLTGGILSTVLAGSVVFVTLYQSSSQMTKSYASAYTDVLNVGNSPTLSAGSGTMVDSRGVQWEYYNAANLGGGHVQLNPNGYCGISANSDYGITGIEEITANFTTAGAELWLLKSTDGTTWHECEPLASGVPSESANKWRYIRFYNYSEDNNPINLNSVSIGYGCSGISSSEDVDSAIIGNVIKTEGLSYSRETTDLSPNSDGGEAVRFTKSGSGSTTLTIGFNESYTLKDVAYEKIEFDIWTTNVSYGKNIEVLNSDGSYTSSKLTAASGLHTANPTDSYVWTSLGNNWYHAELPITALISLISGYGTKD